MMNGSTRTLNAQRVFVFPGKLLQTAKSRSICLLDEKGLVTPASFIMDDVNGIDLFCKQIKQLKSDQFYLRLCFSDNEYPHYFSRVSSLRSLRTDVQNLIVESQTNKIYKYDIIIQPMLPLDYSGCLLKRKDKYLLEVVSGSPILLLREGICLQRFVFTDKKRIIDSRRGNQRYELVFKDCKKKLRPIKKQISFPIDKYLDQIVQSSFGDDEIYEIGFAGKELISFEAKQISKSFFSNLNKRRPFEGPITLTKPNPRFQNVQFDVPNLNYLNQVQPNSNIVIADGPLLSHMVLSCVQNHSGGVIFES